MQKSPMQSLEQPGSMHGLISGIPYRCPIEPRSKPCLQVREPFGRAAGTVFVLGTAASAHPVLPPDPLEVVDLDHDQADDGEEDLRLVHRAPVFPICDPTASYGRGAAPLRGLPPDFCQLRVALVPVAPSSSTDPAGENGDEPEERCDRSDDEQPVDRKANAEEDDGDERQQNQRDHEFTSSRVTTLDGL